MNDIDEAVKAERERILGSLESMMRNGEVKRIIDVIVAEEVKKEREACIAADDFNGNTADDLRNAIRARGT